MNLIKSSLETLEARELIMRHNEVPQSRRLQFLMETSWYVQATRSIGRYPFGSIPTTFRLAVCFRYFRHCSNRSYEVNDQDR